MNYYFYTEDRRNKENVIKVELKIELKRSFETNKEYLLCTMYENDFDVITFFHIKKGVKKFYNMVKKFNEKNGDLEGTDQQTNEQLIDLCACIFNRDCLNHFVKTYTDEINVG